MDFGFDRNDASVPFLYADVSKVQPGFQVSIVSDLRLADNLNLRFLPGISFGAREIVFYVDPDPSDNLSEWVEVDLSKNDDKSQASIQ